MAVTFKTTLPLPPSVNALYFNLKGGGRAKTKIYKDWLVAAKRQLASDWLDAGKPAWPAKTPMQIDIRLGLENRRRDAGNCLKAIEDLLASFLPAPDDRYNDAILIARDASADGMAKITMRELVAMPETLA